jgi:hypothetical protein
MTHFSLSCPETRPAPARKRSETRGFGTRRGDRSRIGKKGAGDFWRRLFISEPDRQLLFGSWMSGYYSASKNELGHI